MAVEASLFAPLGKKRPRRNGASHTELSQESPTSRKRKRSRLVFDAVVVPPLVDVRRQWQLQRRASAEDAAATPMSPPLLHRRLSLPYLRDSDGDNLPQAKRVKRLRHLEDAELSDASPRSSLKALEDIVIAGSDDSIIMAGPQLEHPGSDDDPHIGQVSPRHLASPAPRRRLGFDYDFSSDGFSSSPSRDLIARRQRRFGNVTGQT